MSALANTKVIDLIREKFVPLTIDSTDNYFWSDKEDQKFLSLGLDSFCVRTADGKVLGTLGTTFASNFDQHLLQMLKTALKVFKPSEELVIAEGSKVKGPPEGAVIVNVTAKILSEHKPYTLERLLKVNPKMKNRTPVEQQSMLREMDRYSKMFLVSKGRDNLWIRKDELKALRDGELPVSLQVRLARYHLEDFTRGQAAYWPGKDNLKFLDLKLKDGRLAGTVHLQENEHGRTFRASILGFIEFKSEKLTRFDMVAMGLYEGGHPNTHPELAPAGEFPLAVAFRLASGNKASDQVPPNAMLKIVGAARYLE